jgi:histidinol dehydrogenase
MIRIIDAEDLEGVAALLSAARVRDTATDRRVGRIVAEVRSGGDEALLQYARTLDHLEGGLEVTRSEILAEAAKVPASVRGAIKTAAKHIRIVAKMQVPKDWRLDVAPGVSVEQRVTPLDRVGCYVPGGLYPLPSSLLMTAIPARVAGVREIIVVCPRPEPVVLAAALEAGATRVFRIGGAHAVAAMAYGTESVPRVDKIVGPGNRFVASAKALVATDCGIDFYAGPTEILIVASRGPAAWIAADLIAQAEHDPDARAVLLTPNRALADAVIRAVTAQAPEQGPARTALARHGGVIVTQTMDQAMALANNAAPEHLVLEREALLKQARCAGSIFIGPWSAQVAGDYAIGSNHVLPTAGASRVRGGLSAADFVRQVTVQRLDEAGLRRLGPTVTALARAEGLKGHAASIDIRMGVDQPTDRKKANRR